MNLPPNKSPFQQTMLLFLESKTAIVGLIILTIMFGAGLLAPLLSPQDPYDLAKIDIRDGRLPPGSMKQGEAPKQILKLKLKLPKDITQKPLVEKITMKEQDFLSDLQISLNQIGSDRTYRIKFGENPDFKLGEIAEVRLRRLPKGAKVSVGEKNKFRREWKLQFNHLEHLAFTIPNELKEKHKIEIVIIGAKREQLFTFWLGSDDQGRDMLSAILHGVRISLIVAASSVLIACFFGSIAGLSAAYFGGIVSILVMRLIDLKLSFPSILIAMILLAILGKGIGNVVLAIVLAQWPLYARLVRGVALSEASKEYVEAAKSLGLGSSRIMFRHIMPNCAAPLIVLATLQVASAITLEATLSFLGLGLPVTEPSLGSLIANGFEYLLSGHPWISILPGFVLLLTVIGINFVGDQLRDILNPRLQR